MAIALTNRGQDFNAAFAELYPFATNVNAVLAVLRRDSAATSTLLRDGGQVFSALSQSPASCRASSELERRVRGDRGPGQALANAVRAFPAFKVATALTIDRVNDSRRRQSR